MRDSYCMHPIHPIRRLPRVPGAVLAIGLALTLALQGCSDRGQDMQRGAAASPSAAVLPSPPGPAPAAPASVSPSAPAPPPSSAAPVAAPQAPAAPSGMATSPARNVSLNVQGVAPGGLTVRVKGIEMGGDATVLKVSLSFASHISEKVSLAVLDTYLEYGAGHRLMVQRPSDNRNLSLANGQTLEGELVFMGQVPPGTSQLRLVFNDGMLPDNVVAPNLAMDLPLAPSAGS